MPTMPPRYYEDKYPIARLIFDRANALGLTRRQLVERLGFGDRLAKGHRLLSEIMRTGTLPRYCTAIASPLEVDKTALDEILYATARQQEAEWQHAHSGEGDQPFRLKVITDSGDRDHADHGQRKPGVTVVARRGA